MYRTLHDDLSRAVEATRARDRLRAEREALAGRLSIETARHAELRARLDAERKDVARLERISLQRLLASITGRLEPTLDEERRQADVAELSFVEQGQLVTTLTSGVEELDRRIAALGDVDALHRQAMDAKARLLMERGDEHGRLVVALSERFAELSAMGCELREAIEHGSVLASTLASAATALERAIKHGSYDIWMGGLLTTSDRQYTLDLASRQMQAGALQFERFRKELADTGRVIAPRATFLAAGASSSTGEKLVDYLLGPLGSMEIQKRVKGVARGLAFVRHEVRLSLEELARAYAEGHQAWQELRARLEAAIAAG